MLSLIHIYNNYTEVESAGMLVDLSGEDYISTVQESYLQMVYDVNKDKEEKAYGVPYATNASGVIYNVDKFEEYGIEIPKMCIRDRSQCCCDAHNKFDHTGSKWSPAISHTLYRCPVNGQ